MPAITRREWLWAWVVAVLVVALTCVPYLVGWAITPPGYRFTGLLINPIDGHSYLAKIMQGAAGAWLFRLPFTAEAHEPVLVYTFYLALGHLVPGGSPTTIVWLYHLTRVIMGVVLLLVVYWVSAFIFAEWRQRRLAFLLVCFSSGMGWLLGSGPDLTVPEAITFPSLLVNAHFGTTQLLILLLLFAIISRSQLREKGGVFDTPPAALINITTQQRAAGRECWRWIALTVGSAVLTMMQPFAIPIVGAVGGIWLFLQWRRDQVFPRMNLGRFAVTMVSALPLLLYFFWIGFNHPAVAQWREQNFTPSPPVWGWLVAYGVLWPLAAAGAWRAAHRRSQGDSFLLAWIAGQLLLLLIPIPLQRRLCTGMHIPLCYLAALGLSDVLMPRLRRYRRWLVPAVMVLVVPTNLLIMLAGVSAVGTKNPYVLMNEAQWEAMTWLRENVDSDMVVLADEELGTLVPAWGGGARVVYGHPFETLAAGAKRAAVNDFFSGQMTADQQAEFLDAYDVQVVVDQSGSIPALPDHFKLAWRQEIVSIFWVDGQ